MAIGDQYFGGAFNPNQYNWAVQAQQAGGMGNPTGASTIQQGVASGGSTLPGGIQPGNLQAIIDRFSKSQAMANKANEARYGQLLSGADQMGRSATLANTQLTGQEQARAGSSLISRGLGNSTIVDSVRQGIARQGQYRAQDINERVLTNKQGIIERRTDQQPNLSLLAQLLSRQGAI
jgi:hypothetical protein